MTKIRRQHSAQYKFQIALEAARREKTVSQIASEHNIHPNQVSQWKRQLLESGPEVFSHQRAHQERELEQREAELYEQIGRLRMELEWLKKRWPLSVEMKRAMVEPQHPELSIRRQCELLGLSRTSYYAQPAGESPLNLELVRRIDEQFLATPFYGVPQMTACLRRAGYCVNPKRIRRLMRLMGLEAVYPRPRTSVAAPEHKIHPYLLRGLSVTQPDQVWCADITYVPMTKGYMYLVAVMDWFSRYVIAWRLSNTLDAEFCLDALEQALASGQPKIFNTDQRVSSLRATHSPADCRMPK